LGYLKTYRGRAGGLTPVKPAKEIGAGEVVFALEPMGLVYCIPPRKGCCNIAEVCQLKGLLHLQGLLHRASSAFLAELETMTIADLVAKKSELKARLGF